MAWIEVPAGEDMFQHGYTVGFQDGLCERQQDPHNMALTEQQEWFFWSGGYDTGYKCGREYRLAQYATRMLSEQDLAKHEQEQRRLKQKHSSIAWFGVERTASFQEDFQLGHFVQFFTNKTGQRDERSLCL